jgi:hypothetical protein
MRDGEEEGESCVIQGGGTTGGKGEGPLDRGRVLVGDELDLMEGEETGEATGEDEDPFLFERTGWGELPLIVMRDGEEGEDLPELRLGEELGSGEERELFLGGMAAGEVGVTDFPEFEIPWVLVGTWALAKLGANPSLVAKVIEVDAVGFVDRKLYEKLAGPPSRASWVPPPSSSPSSLEEAPL